MHSSHHSLRDTLLGQYWELKLNPQIYAYFFSELNEFQIKIIGSEIACMINDVSHQIIVDESYLSFLEMGLNINFDEIGSCILKLKLSDTSRLHLIFTSKKRDEQMQIEFAFNEETPLETLSKHLLKTQDCIPSAAQLKTKRRAVCPKCKERRDETRANISSNRLYHIISFACFLDQEIWITYNNEMISFTKSFPPNKESYAEGIISLANSDCVIALDIAEVFNTIAHESCFEGEASTVVNCYNSHGEKLFNLIQQNTELYDMCSVVEKNEDCH